MPNTRVVKDVDLLLPCVPLTPICTDSTATAFLGPHEFPSLTERSSDAYRINQSILDEAQNGIYGLDPKGFVTFVNPAAQRLTGWSLDDLRGRTQHSIVHHSHPDGSHYPQEECPIYQALRDGQIHHREDEVFWRKDGTSFPVAYTSTPVLRHGRPYGAVVMFSDITARIRERAWQHSKNRVYSSIRDRRSILHTIARISEAFAVLLNAPEIRR